MKNSLQPKRDICLAVEKPRIKTRVSNWPFHLMNLWSEMRLINVPRFWNVHAEAAKGCVSINDLLMQNHLSILLEEHRSIREGRHLYEIKAASGDAIVSPDGNLSLIRPCSQKSVNSFAIAHKGYGQMDKSRSVVDLAGNSRQLEIFCECKLCKLRGFSFIFNGCTKEK